MSELIAPKKYPVTTSEVAKMLGLEGSNQDLPLGTFENPGGLPVAQVKLPQNHGTEAPVPTKSGQAHQPSEADAPTPLQPVWLKITKSAGPYVVVFLVGLFLYYFFFIGVNFSGLFKPARTPVTPKETALQSLESQNLSAYQTWIAGFYYDVSDPKVIAPDADNSGNGLSNFQKYLLDLNPKAYDTLGLGKPDSQTLADGTNPLTGSPLTGGQKAVLDKYIDMEVVMNRLALSNMQRLQGAVAGASTNTNPAISNPPAQQNSYGFQNSPIQPTPAPATGAVFIRGPAPVTGANITPTTGSQADINTDVPGRLEIPDLKINVPIMWTKNPKDFDTDLQSGVVHYPGTALPGDIGTAYISGHSSNYIWAKGNYNRVFSTLGNLADNTSFKITVVSKTGKDVIYYYVVTRRQEYSPTDQAQFANNGDSVVALSTCWPVNSTAKRLVVFGKLTQVVR